MKSIWDEGLWYFWVRRYGTRTAVVLTIGLFVVVMGGAFLIALFALSSGAWLFGA